MRLGTIVGCNPPARSRWPLLGLLVALAFFGHDVLAAAEASLGYAAPSETSMSVPLDFQTGRAHPSKLDWPDQEMPLPHHGLACDVDPAVARFHSRIMRMRFLTTSAAVVATTPPVATRPAGRVTSPAAAPVAPPAVRRALLQVFLI
jgi:hypothetical protein